ncbi:MAG: enoyl-CoA hydratase/isomerase family protein [Planctomycetes bacterium]|nr:enoyl-CoA hydratase/isomerase family protein [Planctomycetota bacterium]
MSDLATLSIEGRIATLTLNRPDKRNALSLDLLASLHEKVDQLASNAGVSVCVVTGAGATFCAGMDLKAVLKEPGAPLRLLSSIAELTIKIRRLPQVTIARVNGAAIGGGCGLVCVCDIAVTHADAKLGFPEVDLGVCPAVVAPWLVLAIGAGRARRVLLEGGTMSGHRAAELGMVEEAVEPERLDGAVRERAERLAKAGPNALRATKRLLHDLESERLEAAVRRGAEVSAEVIGGAEAQAMLGKVYGG